jgi:hypothetical protein
MAELTSYGALQVECQSLRTTLAAVAMEYGHGKLEIPTVAIEAGAGSQLVVQVTDNLIIIEVG